ncbi:ABC transporter substrate-binding protein [Chromobacterium sp. LK11]|uniref:substrate-binding periplasmic protein n=1 Tax=Chromobacterium sp. LK11 TaxID=1628212 RepID=UPI00069E3A52|nr:transporter substrate-binding domain-containing protein [Chromobacterium sp. LK11]
MSKSALALLTLLAGGWVHAAPVLRIVVGSAEPAPFIQHASAQLSGPVIELARQAAEHCGLNAQFRQLPARRLLRSLALDQADAAAMLSFQADRAKQMLYPMRDGQADSRLRLTALSYVLYVPQDSTLRWDGYRLDLPEDDSVGVNRGWSVIRELKARRIPTEAGADLEENFAKLQAGRIAAFAMHEPGGDAYLAQHPQLRMKKLLPPLKTENNYLVFGKAYGQAHPERMRCVWRQLPPLRRQLALP